MEAHIRLEERVVFPLIEETLLDHALSEVSQRLEAFEAGSSGAPAAPGEVAGPDPTPDPGGEAEKP